MGTPYKRKVLTDRMCVRTKPAKKDVLLWDTNVPGLLLRISPKNYQKTMLKKWRVRSNDPTLVVIIHMTLENCHYIRDIIPFVIIIF